MSVNPRPARRQRQGPDERWYIETLRHGFWRVEPTAEDPFGDGGIKSFEGIAFGPKFALEDGRYWAPHQVEPLERVALALETICVLLAEMGRKEGQ